jgi:hypothetical protein
MRTEEGYLRDVGFELEAIMACISTSYEVLPTYLGDCFYTGNLYYGVLLYEHLMGIERSERNVNFSLAESS